MSNVALPHQPNARTGAASCRVLMSGPTLVIRPRGEIDIAATTTLQEAVGVIHPGVRSVHVDMSGVTFMDSSGVRFLTQARARSRAVRAAFHLTGMTTMHRRILHLTGFLDTGVRASEEWVSSQPQGGA